MAQPYQINYPLNSVQIEHLNQMLDILFDPEASETGNITLSQIEDLDDLTITESQITDLSTGEPFGLVTLTDGATPALDASLGSLFYLAASGNRTIAVPTNPTEGQKIVIRHHAVGANRTLSLNTGAGGFRFGTDVAALSATTSGTMDYIGAVWNEVDSFWDVVAYSKGY